MAIFRGKSAARLSLLLAVLAAALLPGLRLSGQVTGAALSGTITDASGAVLSGAHVVIENTGTEVTREAVTDKDGLYNAPNLLPGSYEVTISAPGFATQVRHGIVLNVGGAQLINVQMSVGQLTDRVEVDDRGPVLQLGTSELNAVVDSTTVRELPLNGRSWTDLATLQPGVVRVESQFNAGSGADRGERGFGAQLSISGGKPIQNNYRLDGISVNDYANGGPGSVLGVSLGVDAIQEFSVITSNYSAAYGRTSGGVVNAITRAGTNDFHGSVYEFFRNSALDGRNYFDFDPSGKPFRAPFNRNQFGGSAGGPIVKNRTFIFGDYEGIRQSKGIATQVVVPSDAARNGILSTGTVAVDPAAAKYLPFWPKANLPGPNADTGIFSFTGQQILSEDFFTTKVDHTISQADSVAATYLFDNTPFTAPDHLDITLQGHHVKRQVAALEETHVFSPSLLNSFHFGFNRVSTFNNKGVSAINPLGKDPSLASTPGQFASRVNVASLTSLPGGLGAVDHFTHGWNSFQAYDDAFLTRGTHNFKTGVALEYIRENTTAFADVAGNWSFGSISDFLTNTPQSFDSALIGANPRNIRQTIFGVYFQDTWKLRKNFTLDYGLRYEMATVPAEAHGKFVSLRNITDAQPRTGSQVFDNPTLHNVEPRVGFAWDPTGNAKTVVHGAFGVFDVLPLPYVVSLLQVRPAPFNLIGTVTDQSKLKGKFYGDAFPLLGVQSLASTYIQQKPKRNYVMTWNLNVQREITPNFAVIAGYIGSRGVHQQFKVDDADMTLPTLTPAGYLFPHSANGPLPTVNPNFGAIRALFWNGDSSYNALEIGATKRMSHGFQFQGSYTYSKSMDDNSTGAGADSYGNSLSSLHWYDTRINRSVSDFNTPHVLSLSGTWDAPTPHFSSTFAQKTLGGWELGSILTAQSGQPFTATVGGDPLGQNSSDPFAFPNRLTTPGCHSLTNSGSRTNYIKVQCFTMAQAPSQEFYNANCDPAAPYPTCLNLLGNARRNILAGPRLINLDFSLYKNTPVKRISETFNTQFRLEFFNVLNHPNFQPPLDNSQLFDNLGNPQGAGVLDATTTDPREIQIAFKVTW